MAETHDPGRERGRQLDRVSAFSDGVFSIAATLLVLSIDIPTGPASTLPKQLRALEDPLESYFISFAVVGLFWFHHHRMMGRLRASDTGFATLNLIFLAFIALTPAPTELIGRYGGETAPVVIYAVNVIVLAVLSRQLSQYADRHGLTDRPAAVEPWLIRWSAVIAFSISIPVAFVAPRHAIYCWFLAAILPFIARRMDRRKHPQHPPTGLA